jgi:hypothetical protein
MTQVEIDAKNAEKAAAQRAEEERKAAETAKENAEKAKQKANEERHRKEDSYPVHVGDAVIVRGYKTHKDGSLETPGIVNGVTLNPTAQDLEDIASASKKVVSLTTDATVKDALAKAPEDQVVAEVSPCTVDVAVFPRGADHRNLAGVTFFASRDAAEKFYDTLPDAVKNVDGPAGCVAYWPAKASKKESHAKETHEAHSPAHIARKK